MFSRAPDQEAVHEGYTMTQEGPQGCICYGNVAPSQHPAGGTHSRPIRHGLGRLVYRRGSVNMQ